MIVVISIMGGHSAPPPQLALNQLWWLVPVVLTVVVSGVYTSMWGAPKLSPRNRGASLHDRDQRRHHHRRPLGGRALRLARDVLGVILISLAGVLESAVESLRPRQA